MLEPRTPGHDLLDDAIARLHAMKSVMGTVLARALESAHARFLVFGSTLAVLAAKVADLEARDKISWPALDKRISAYEAGQVSAAEWRDVVIRRLERLEGIFAETDESHATRGMATKTGVAREQAKFHLRRALGALEDL